jgi:hypothetical protein
VPASAEAHEWHRIIRASVRECLETWHLQSKNGPVTVEALEAILSRSIVPILRHLSLNIVVLLTPLVQSTTMAPRLRFTRVGAAQ